MPNPWTTASDELRSILSDGPTDKLRYRKYIIGIQDGTNTAFKTLEFRRVSDFKDPLLTTTLGVFKNGVRLDPTTDISSDDLGSAEFILAAAPANSDKILCTYYIQWFLDSELNVFLQNSSRWLGFGDDFTQLQSGLQPSALKYATADSYQKLSLRWAEYLSETYRTEDAESEDRMAVVSAYQKAAIDYRKEATMLRDHFYTRQGQSLAPLFGSNLGRVRDVPPRA